jgi:hypothetical protein
MGESINSQDSEEIRQQKEAVRQRVDQDPDFINLKRFGYSLEKLLERYPEDKHPEGCPRRIVAAALDMTEAEVAKLEEAIIVKLRRAMKAGG